MNEIPQMAVRVIDNDSEWWISATDFANYLRAVGDWGKEAALCLEDEQRGFATFSVATAVARLADAIDVSMIAETTRARSGQ